MIDKFNSEIPAVPLADFVRNSSIIFGLAPAQRLSAANSAREHSTGDPQAWASYCSKYPETNASNSAREEQLAVSLIVRANVQVDGR